MATFADHLGLPRNSTKRNKIEQVKPKRASETIIETAQRKEQDQAGKAKREHLKLLETAQRQEQDRAHKAKRRASETVIEIAQTGTRANM